jgi:hypothetical protein
MSIIKEKFAMSIIKEKRELNYDSVTNTYQITKKFIPFFSWAAL